MYSKRRRLPPITRWTLWWLLAATLTFPSLAQTDKFNMAKTPMRQRIAIFTIGVDDLERSMRFYRALGWKTEGIVGTEFDYGAVAFFELDSGLIFALYPRKSLALDAQTPLEPASATEFSIGYNVSTPAEVDNIVELAERAGARVVKKPQKTFWGGYAGYFQDPDRHLWEILWNPQLLPRD